MKRKIAVFLGLIMIVSAMLCACSAAAEPAAGGNGIKDTVTVAIRQDFQSLDPCGSYSGVDMTLRYCIYESLLKLDENLNLVPCLAESYEWVNDTTIRFKLRQGVKFHTGDTMTAEDVMFSLKRAQGSAFSGGNINCINFDKSSIVDASTIELVCDYVYGPLLSALADPYYAMITSEKYVEENGGDLSSTPMGTGAFKFVDYYPGDRIEMQRFDEYWGETSQFTNLVFRIISDNNTRAIEVESGGVDIARLLAVSDVLRIKEEGTATIAPINMPSNGYLACNCDKAPFDNKLVRQAIMYALDRTAINEAVYRGEYPNMESVLGHTVVGYSDDLPKYARDLDKSKALLAEAGYPNGFECTLDVAEDNSLVTMAEMVKNQLAEVGVNVTINVFDATTTASRLYAGEHDMSYCTWGSSNGDADSALYPCFHSSQHDVSGFWYANPEVDKYLEEERSTVDVEARMKALEQVQLLLNEDLPWIYIHDLVYHDAISKNVEGFVSNPLMCVDYTKVVVHE